MSRLLCLPVLALLALPIAANAQLASPEVEQLEKRDKAERDDRPRGPITAIRPGALLLTSFDKDGDYGIDISELDQGKAAAFSRADTNQNGSLSLFELEAWRLKALGSLSAAPGNYAFDRNIDQVITRQEFDDALQEVFERADKNKDQRVIFSEIVRVFTAAVTSQRERPEGREKRAPRGSQGGRADRRISP